ncbi:MAG: hypothetical protein FWG91_00405 [Lachnospiraceae bacterium]|nr:hypothetical protein [Lachnospiraceae bacterium]
MEYEAPEVSINGTDVFDMGGDVPITPACTVGAVVMLALAVVAITAAVVWNLAGAAVVGAAGVMVLATAAAITTASTAC